MKFLRRILVLALLPLSFNAVHAEHHGGGAHIETTEVAPDLYMLHGVGGFTGGNIGVSIGADGVVMIDNSMPPFLDQLQEQLASITDQPIEFLINTHVHGDHTGNNTAMAESGARIVSHETLRSRMKSDPKSPDSGLPVITFTEEMSFYLNDQPARLIHTPHAHTDGDSIIVFTAANVIHAGDIFFRGLFPYIDIDSGGSVAGFIAAQERVLKLSDADTKIIPGHGPLANKADLQQDLAMLKEARQLVAGMIAADHDIDAILEANPLAKYQDYNWEFITTERMTRTLYRDIAGE
jgi:glyoxylase-like metal-dependent hydrolase (beta-lactamase superfamily II)